MPGKTIVAMSDTHGRHHNLQVPDGDVLIHAGDFCRYGSRDDVNEFAEWFEAFPHRWKIVISGNHDAAMEKYLGYGQAFTYRDITYLRGDWTLLKGGPKIWGGPWTPPFQSWHFMLEEGALAKKFATIPDDIDVLLTHGPPAGVLDVALLDNSFTGSTALADRVTQLLNNDFDKPLVHIFGHIHEMNGVLDQGKYRAYNVSICDFKYNPVNPCTVIEWNVPEPIDPSA